MEDHVEAVDANVIGAVVLKDPSKEADRIHFKRRFKSRDEAINWLLEWTLDNEQAQAEDKKE